MTQWKGFGKYYSFTSEEFQCKMHFQNTVQRLNDGRFSVSLPWKLPISKLQLSRELALRRFYYG